METGASPGLLFSDGHTAMILTYTLPKHPPARFETESDAIVIGRRPLPDQHVDLDLDSDDYISRTHTRITFDDGRYWVEDLGSANGTWINGAAIAEKRPLAPGDYPAGRIYGDCRADGCPAAAPEPDQEDTVLHEQADAPAPPVESPPPVNLATTAINPEMVLAETAIGPPPADADDVTLINPDLLDTLTDPDPVAAPEPPPDAEDEPGLAELGEIVNAGDMTIHPLIGSGQDTVDEVLTESWRQIKAFNDLVQKLNTAGNLDTLVQILIKNLQQMIPNALRGAVLLPDERGELLLKAHWPAGDPSFSMTWVRRAFEKREAFVWTASGENGAQPDLPSSAIYHRVQSAIYLPLLVGQEALGVLYTDNYYDREAFTATDLELFKASPITWPYLSETGCSPWTGIAKKFSCPGSPGSFPENLQPDDAKRRGFSNRRRADRTGDHSGFEHSRFYRFEPDDESGRRGPDAQ